ncbi:hypothetical protein TREMEDRAFT_60898 [Tremella mesenterica DSM 1558]|uniref:uncharacterized protein n=1 Tax=Tremella mesenterica (strain ATCC 24925 / CBS 8224 / DSM 1558 / NBRC 9311 / NRRL Y-6157 / RJB 2259-6 / UBC 559-6) TaxID=578456 RepID=UPI0003F499DF|nr:uncharacterized protein TREMEDRAFT_60898 [Tremella mesenterica DSM 1558]EIW70401.1 hypothetical protein TREMEDRAFT_60898 [Tremella mesenterica DSM 1558]
MQQLDSAVQALSVVRDALRTFTVKEESSTPSNIPSINTVPDYSPRTVSQPNRVFGEGVGYIPTQIISPIGVESGFSGRGSDHREMWETLRTENQTLREKVQNLQNSYDLEKRRADTIHPVQGDTRQLYQLLQHKDNALRTAETSLINICTQIEALQKDNDHLRRMVDDGSNRVRELENRESAAKKGESALQKQSQELRNQLKAADEKLEEERRKRMSLEAHCHHLEQDPSRSEAPKLAQELEHKKMALQQISKDRDVANAKLKEKQMEYIKLEEKHNQQRAISEALHVEAAAGQGHRVELEKVSRDKERLKVALKRQENDMAETVKMKEELREQVVQLTQTLELLQGHSQPSLGKAFNNVPPNPIKPFVGHSSLPPRPYSDVQASRPISQPQAMEKNQYSFDMPPLEPKRKATPVPYDLDLEPVSTSGSNDETSLTLTNLQRQRQSGGNTMDNDLTRQRSMGNVTDLDLSRYRQMKLNAMDIDVNRQRQMGGNTTEMDSSRQRQMGINTFDMTPARVGNTTVDSVFGDVSGKWNGKPTDLRPSFLGQTSMNKIRSPSPEMDTFSVMNNDPFADLDVFGNGDRMMKSKN